MEPHLHRRSRTLRLVWMAVGLACVALGAIGVVVPGIPTTGFMVAAAWCCSRSSTRLETWLLGLPGVGRMVGDYRAGLGMPRRAKAMACPMIVGMCAFSGWRIDRLWVVAGVAIAGVVGVGWILWRVPTREVVLAQRCPPPTAYAGTAGESVG